MFDVSREMGSSVALYCRKVLIQTKATDILPKWLRFLRGQKSIHISAWNKFKCIIRLQNKGNLIQIKFCLVFVFSGVVDSEDIPLNLSRELLQESALIRYKAAWIWRYIFCFVQKIKVTNSLSFRKLRDVLQQRVIRFLLDQSKKDPEKYARFFDDYGLFMREGIVTTAEQSVKVRNALFSLHNLPVSLRSF